MDECRDQRSNDAAGAIPLAGMEGELALAAFPPGALGTKLFVEQDAFKQVVDILALQSRMFVHSSDRAPD